MCKSNAQPTLCEQRAGFAAVKTFIRNGTTVVPALVEVAVFEGRPDFELPGFPEPVIREIRERLRAALVNSGFQYPFRHIAVSMPVVRPRRPFEGTDLAIAVALLIATEQVEWNGLGRVAVVAELALDGSTRSVQGIRVMVEQAGENGIEAIVVPAACAAEATGLDGVAVVGLGSLRQLPAIATGGQRGIQPEVGVARTVAEQFGRNLAMARARTGVTQLVLAQRVGLSDSAISLLERGKRGARVDPLVGLAEALDIDPGELLADTGGLQGKEDQRR
jgi:DNA-binding XRE family transcriptional regulator